MILKLSLINLFKIKNKNRNIKKIRAIINGKSN